MDLKNLGWEEYVGRFPEYAKLLPETVARVAVENRTNYLLYSVLGEMEGVVRGKLLGFAEQSGDFPKVGDWVIAEKLPGEQKAVIESILPRYSVISRKAPGEEKEQAMAANVDMLFIVQSLDHGYNVRKMERYLALAQQSGVRPVVLLNKSDMAEDAAEKVFEAKQAALGALVLSVSAKTMENLDAVKNLMHPGVTVAFMGSSGVGKSTLINGLLGRDAQLTSEVRVSDSKGRHTTTRREMFLLPGGGVFIDTPGMRELALLENDMPLGGSFGDLEELAAQCGYNDCDHEKSEGCAIIAAVREGRVEQARYLSFLKLRRETQFREIKESTSAKFLQRRKARRFQREKLKVLKDKYSRRKGLG